MEIYSIDESFLDLSDVRDRDRRGSSRRDLRATVRAWTGIPTCVGIGPTKTLAKLANHIAKTIPDLDGVCDLTDPVDLRSLALPRSRSSEVWGIGRASLAKLEALGLSTRSRTCATSTRARCARRMTVVGERIIYELRGLACLPLETDAGPAQGLRGHPLVLAAASTDRETLEQAVAAHATRLGEKLRRGGLGTDHVSVFFHTSEHDRGDAAALGLDDRDAAGGDERHAGADQGRAGSAWRGPGARRRATGRGATARPASSPPT